MNAQDWRNHFVAMRRPWFVLLVLSMSFSILFAAKIAVSNIAGGTGFRGVYFGTRCLMQGCDPYRVEQLTQFYETENQILPATAEGRETLIRYVNLPTTFVVIAPFALMPWKLALAAWMGITGMCLLGAVYFIFRISSSISPGIALLFCCVLCLNCEVVFATGNTAGVVVGLCLLAVCSFVLDRYSWMGVVCLAISMAIKPHDSGLVWLYFFLEGGVNRKRALAALLLTLLIAFSAGGWVTHVVPHWLPELRANLDQINAPGGLNDPGLDSLTGRSAAMVISLQALISVFNGNPTYYNTISYLICGACLLIWVVSIHKGPANTWLALSVVAPLTLLFTYHRPYDAKLMLLSVPACAMLWRREGFLRWAAFAVTTLGIVMTSDIPLAITVAIASALHVVQVGLQGNLLTVMLSRPASLALLLNVVFYLWVYWREPRTERKSDETASTRTEAAQSEGFDRR